MWICALQSTMATGRKTYTSIGMRHFIFDFRHVKYTWYNVLLQHYRMYSCWKGGQNLCNRLRAWSSSYILTCPWPNTLIQTAMLHHATCHKMVSCNRINDCANNWVSVLSQVIEWQKDRQAKTTCDDNCRLSSKRAQWSWHGFSKYGCSSSKVSCSQVEHCSRNSE